LFWNNAASALSTFRAAVYLLPKHMKIIIIGVGHTSQNSSIELQNLLTEITESESVIVIGEEARGQSATFVQRIAMERGVPWVQIDMTTKERQDAGIADILDTRMEHSSPFQSSNGIISDEQWAAAFDENGQVIQKLVYSEKEDGMREYFWLDRISEAAMNGTAIIVCGALHARPLAEKAHQRRHTTVLLFRPEMPLSEYWISKKPMTI
jgi:hypothetical protein